MADWTVILTTVGAAAFAGGFGYAGARAQSQEWAEEAQAQGIEVRFVEPPAIEPGKVAGSATFFPGIRKPKPESERDEEGPLRDDDGTGVA